MSRKRCSISNNGSPARRSLSLSINNMSPNQTHAPSSNSSPANSITGSRGRMQSINESPSHINSLRKACSESDIDDDERSYMSSASGKYSVQSETSHKSNNSNASMRSIIHKERVDRKLIKPDYTYHYNCQSENHGSTWSASFDKPLEEFIYPSLQIKSIQKKIQQFTRSGSQRVVDNTDSPKEDEIEYPRWSHTQSVERETRVVDEKALKFAEDMHRGEKYIRENLQRNYRKRMKAEADAEKKRNNLNSTSTLKKTKRMKSRFSIVESGVGLVVGSEASFFLPKPADEVVR